MVAPAEVAGGDVDAVVVEIVSQSMAGVVEEMQNSLFCTGYSTIIRESRDASCAILDLQGRVVAQHTVLPLHLGAFPACMEHLLGRYPTDQMREGDAFILNHPYLGGSPHATDVAVVAPIHVDGVLFGFGGSIAHKSDIGGLVPGTNSGQAREIFHEGLLLPPIRFYSEHEPILEVEAILRANSRTPDLVVGDLRGQVGATHLGADRVSELCRKHSAEVVSTALDRLIGQTELRVRAAIEGWPDGRYEGRRALHNEGMEEGAPVCVRVSVVIDGDRILFDFSESDDQTTGPYNIRPPLARAVCYYVLKCLIDPDMPDNAGMAAAIDATFRPGSLVSPEFPAPVNTYMPIAVATAEAVFDALGQAIPRGRIAESSAGTNGTLAHSVTRRGYPEVQYELPAGAIGARHNMDGVSASKAHVANGSLMPVEIIESEFPVELERFDLVIDSGGAGRYRGGLGYVREYRLLGDARFATRGGRELTPPMGKEGGGPGLPSRIVLNPKTPGERDVTAADGNLVLREGDVLRIAQAGGGGYGDPLTRPAAEVLRDVREGYVSAEAARERYGVVLAGQGPDLMVDEARTAQLRVALAPPGRSTAVEDDQIGLTTKGFEMGEPQVFPAVGIVGLGAMGRPIAENMLAKGVAVSVFDLDLGKLELAKSAGASVASTAGELGRTCAITLIVVQTDDDVLDVGSEVAAAAGAGHVLVICSSVRPDTCRELAEIAANGGVKVVDVALTGGVRGAVEGRLNLLAGGDEPDVERLRPVLETIASGVHHLGPLGSGQVGKTANNLLHWAEIVAIVEALQLADSLGVSPAKLRAALQAGPTDGRTLREMEEFRLTWWKKDLENAFEMAGGAGGDVPLSHKVSALMPAITVQSIAELLGGDGPAQSSPHH